MEIVGKLVPRIGFSDFTRSCKIKKHLSVRNSNSMGRTKQNL